MKKTLIYVISALVLITAVYFIFFNKKTNEYSLKLDKVSSGDLTVYVTATGTISAVTTVQVGSQVSGTISKLYADYNSIVKEGQLIAQIDPTNLQQALHDAEATLEKGQSQANESQRSFDRSKALFDKKLESQSDYDASLTTLEMDKATLKQYKAQLERAKINLAYATIYAPISGVVIDRQVSVGQTVAASFSSPTLFTIANDLSKMQVLATVDESDIGKITVGQDASFTVDAFNDTFHGKVSQIRLSAVVISNVVNYTVVIDVPNDDLKLMPGMTATIKILVGKKNNVMRVLNTALRLQPAMDLVDTLKMKELRDAFKKGSNGGSEQMKGSTPIAENSGKKNDLTSDPSAQKVQRDHNNKKPDDLWQQESSMNKKDGRKGQQQKVSGKSKSSSASGTKFGIIQSFPQYQKSSVLPTDQLSRGRVWIKNSSGKLEPVFVKTGLNDGQYTEIITDKLKEGDEIVVGVISNNSTATQATRSPLTGQGGSPQGGGGPR
jgi:HlyD family secretion protein